MRRFSRRAGGQRHTLPEAGMVELLARGETARVTIGGVQRRQVMLGTEEIEIESERRRCEKDTNARKGNRDESASHHRIKIVTQAAECPPAINQVGEVPFSLCAGAIGAAVSTSTRRRCNRRRHDECS